MNEKVSHKELVQPDRIEEFFFHASNYMYQHRNQFFGAAAVFVVLTIGGFVGVRQHQQSKVDQANLFYNTQKEVQAAPSAEQLSLLSEFQKTHPDTIYGISALMNIAALSLEEKKEADAITAYESVLQHPQADAFLKNKARLGLVAVYENQKNWQNAQQQATSIEGSDWEGLRLKTLARLAMEQGNSQEARTHLEQLITLSDSPYRRDAESLLLTLK